MIAKLAAEKEIALFSALRNSDRCGSLFLLLHTALLHSLLRGLGYPVPMAALLYCEDRRCEQLCELLLQCFSESPIRLEQEQDTFSWELIGRKDEPLIIVDALDGSLSKVNRATLQTVLASGKISARFRREGYDEPLRALPVVITEQVSELTCSPMWLTIDIKSEDVDMNRCIELLSDCPDNKEYVSTFLSYASEHVHDLKVALDHGRKYVLGLDEARNLTVEAMDTLVILVGVREFLEGFAAVANFRLEDVVDEWCTEMLLLRLMEASEKVLGFGDLASGFIDLVSQLIREEEIPVYAKGYPKKMTDEAIYCDEDYFYIGSGALWAICRRTTYSRPTIISALEDAGLLRGRPLNNKTKMTRITLASVYGEQKRIDCFQMAREVFEPMGEPHLVQMKV